MPSHNSGTALDEAAVRELRRYRWKSLGWLFAGLAALGIAVATALLASDPDSDAVATSVAFCFVFALFTIVLGVWSLVRTRLQRRVLSRSSWVSYPLSYREIPLGQSFRSLLLLGPAPAASPILTLPNLSRMRLRLSGIRNAGTVDVAGDPRSKYDVVRVPGSVQLLSARPPFIEYANRRWRRPFGAIF